MIVLGCGDRRRRDCGRERGGKSTEQKVQKQSRQGSGDGGMVFVHKDG